MVVNAVEHKDRSLDLEAFREYLDVRVIQGTLSPDTVTTYLAVLLPFWAWLHGRVPCRELDQQYLDSLTLRGKSPSTVATTAHAIKRWHRWRGESVDLEYPTVAVGEPKYLDVDQIEELLEWCVTPLEQVLIRVLFDTAVRISELMRITLDDIDWEQGLVGVTRKGGHKGKVVMQPESMKAIREWLSVRRSDDDRVFMDFDSSHARALIKKIGRRAGLHVTPHMFRHSRAIQMLMLGIDPYIVQQHLGHLDIRTTLNIYGKFLPQHLRSRIPDPFKRGGSNARPES